MLLSAQRLALRASCVGAASRLLRCGGAASLRAPVQPAVLALQRVRSSSSASASASGEPAAPSSSSPPPPPRLGLDNPSGLSLSGSGRGTGVDLPASRPSYYQPSPHNAFVRRYYYLLSAIGMFSRTASTGANSEEVYRSIEEQATQSVWWDALGLKRSWITEHALISLHVWLFHNRFKVDFNQAGVLNGRRMQEALFERLWEDTTIRIRNAGIVEISVNKQLENVQKITFDDMFSYDAALRADVLAEEEGGTPGMELAAALWKGVFREEDAADSEAVVRLADYTRRELLSLLAQPAEDVYRGWVTWGPCVGESAEERLERQRRMLAGEWREALHVDGRVYFYHTASHETRWTPPEDGMYTRRRFALTRFLEAAPQLASGDAQAHAAAAAAAAAAATAPPAAQAPSA